MSRRRPEDRHADNIDPRNLFISAMDYRVAAALIDAAKTRRPHLIFAAFVNFALNVELLLKCICTLETQRTPWGHDLMELFSKCSATSQDEMDALFLRNCHKERFTYDHYSAEVEPIAEPFGLRWVLNESGKTFEKLRYRHEIAGDPPAFLLESFGHAAMVQVFKFRPEWRELRPDLREYRDIPDEGPITVSRLQTGFESTN